MDFQRKTSTTVLKVCFSDYYSGECLFCGGKLYKIVDSWLKKVAQLGGPAWKVNVEIEMKTILCLNPECEMKFTPEHPNYPKGFHYSLDVIEKALNQAHHFTRSAQDIAFLLKEDHNVEVSSKAVQGWINAFSEEFFQAYFSKHPDTAVDDFRAITIDGTWFSQGKALIGKKKAVQSLSVTKLQGGHYLLTWWE
jgi:hypothetical protein